MVTHRINNALVLVQTFMHDQKLYSRENWELEYRLQVVQLASVSCLLWIRSRLMVFSYFHASQNCPSYLTKASKINVWSCEKIQRFKCFWNNPFTEIHPCTHCHRILYITALTYSNYIDKERLPGHFRSDLLFCGEHVFGTKNITSCSTGFISTKLQLMKCIVAAHNAYENTKISSKIGRWSRLMYSTLSAIGIFVSWASSVLIDFADDTFL